MWFRRDLRLSDNPALNAAAKEGMVLPIYIIDNLAPNPFKPGDATKAYLEDALQQLNDSVQGHLNIYTGEPSEIIAQLNTRYCITYIAWNRCYEPWYIKHDTQLEKLLNESHIKYTIFNGSYLWNPNDMLKNDGSYYKVFGAYQKKVLLVPPRKPFAQPNKIKFFKDQENKTKWHEQLHNSNNNFTSKMKKDWQYGEQVAQKKLTQFITTRLTGYATNRDYPSLAQTSQLSEHLHFGEISPHHVWDAIINAQVPHADKHRFLSELIWREFSAYVLIHNKQLHAENFKPQFNAFPWTYNAQLFDAWKMGKTGYPLVDAGMRELLHTGRMHNRVRMIVASFLVKNLMIHWHHGRDWFWNHLVDADLANNSMNWQWVAGSGVDATPYFRIFNPTTQGKKFDPKGIYTRSFIPELTSMPDQYLFEPWKAPEATLKKAEIRFGIDYPQPIVDLNESRKTALAGYKTIR